MRWFNRIKVAAWGHGNTREGEHFERTLANVTKRIRSLSKAVLQDQLQMVLPRWRGQIRREILVLPDLDRIERMSMYELQSLQRKLDLIEAEMRKYSAKRFGQIVGE